MDLSPLITVHLTAALGAVVVGPVALWARKSGSARPKMHRAFGYAWVTLMMLAATSAIFIRDFRLPNINGFTLIHLLIPVVYGMLFLAFWFLARGNINGHRKTMLGLYIGGCGVAGAFTLLPGRFLGNLVWGQWLGLIPASYQPPQGTPMIAQILINTPLWVWGLLVALLALGWSQALNRRASLVRIALLPLGMGLFSLFGTVSAFGTAPGVLGAWLLAAALLLAMVVQRPLPPGVHYEAASRQFQLPGSWAPMVLIIGIFLTKYAVGVSLVLYPALRLDTNFGLAIASLYGVFSGIFAGRALRLILLARQPAGVPAYRSLHA